MQIKQEIIESSNSTLNPIKKPNSVSVIDLLSSSDFDSDSSDSSDSDGEINGKPTRVSNSEFSGSVLKKRKKLEELGVVLPVGFLDPLPNKEAVTAVPLAARETITAVPLAVEDTAVAFPFTEPVTENGDGTEIVKDQDGCKQFWKAGDYEGGASGDQNLSYGGMDHVRVHPKFLHSNATSHKWVLGAFAELLDNSLDEVCNGATHASVDMVKNKKDGSRMLLIEDNGGGMDPEKMRHCLSLGYSAKSKVADTIGQYGNGFKTSTMRLGADVIVFSRCRGKNGQRPTQSIGLLSYTFLKSTGKQDIVVPMLDYESKGQEWNKLIRSSAGDWDRNLETVVQWSPFSSGTDLLRQFHSMKDQGTRIVIYNLWEDDQGLLELDFDTDPHDIQIRGVNRDEKNIQMAKQYPNSMHFLTYRHSLRSYASILYLRVPASFRIILRGKDVEHHNIVNDMMMTEKVTYRPQPGPDGVPKDSNMVAVVTIGFVKDAKFHIDVQGFNVYHKNRLIKPFWRLWHAPGSDGRGVIGVLEANFVEPAHDKQGFERTTVLSRLEARLVQMQKQYWSMNCHKIGYASRRNKNSMDVRETSPDYHPRASSQSKRKSNVPSGKTPVSNSDKSYSRSGKQEGRDSGRYSKTVGEGHENVHLYSKGKNTSKRSRKEVSSLETSSPSAEDVSEDDVRTPRPDRQENGSSYAALLPSRSHGSDGSQTIRSPTVVGNGESEQDCLSGGRAVGFTRPKEEGVSGNQSSPSNFQSHTLMQLRRENQEIRGRLNRTEAEILGDLLHDLQHERERCKLLETQIEEATLKIEELNMEQESLTNIFSEERKRRDKEEESLRKKLKDASSTIQELVEKVRLLEKMRSRPK